VSGLRFAILCRSPVVLLNDLGAAALESQNRKPDPGLSVSGLFHGGDPGSYGTLNFAIPLKLQRFIRPKKIVRDFFTYGIVVLCLRRTAGRIKQVR
jgi:hypothetical protein